MKTVNLNNQTFESYTAIMHAVARAIESEEENVISANYDGECISVHSLNDEDEEGEIIDWYCDEIFYNADKEGSVSSVNIDC